MNSATVRWIAIATLLCPTAYYALISHSPLPDHRLIVGINDIVLHAGAFALLAVVALAGNRRYWLTIACLIGLAIILELGQLFEPERETSLRDLASSLGGVAAGAVIVFAAETIFSRFRWKSDGS